MTLKPEEIQDLIEKMANQSRAIMDNLASMVWFMRGGLTWDRAYLLTPKEVHSINKTIKTNIEQTEKAKMPLL